MSIENLAEIAPNLISFAILAVLIILLAVVALEISELRRIRRRVESGFGTAGAGAEAIVAELRLMRNALEEVGPMRYAVAGLLAVRHEHRLETADIRADIAEILREWEEIDRAVGEIGETVNKVRAAAR